MRDLTVTKAVERWARRRRLQGVVRDGARALLVAVVLGGGTIAFVAWFPSWSFLFIPASIAVIGCGLWVGWRQRAPVRTDPVAAEVDALAETEGLLRTALAVEGGRASASPEMANVVRAKAVAELTRLEPMGSPPVRIPFVALGLALLATLVVTGTLLGAKVVDAMRQAELMAPGAPAFDEARAAELAEALETLEQLAAEPGVDALSKRDLQLAAEQVRAALARRSEPRQAAKALDEARRSLAGLQDRPLTSAAALQSARSEDLADGMERALRRQDPGAARRLGEEVLRRVDGAATDGELRRLGQALAERVEDPSDAGGAARKAGRSLQNGERGEALAALADLMASLGEPVRIEPNREALAGAMDAVEQAHQDTVQQLDSERGGGEQRDGERRERASETPDGQTPEPGDGSTPSPVDVPQGGEGDGGGGSAKGGTEDLKEGGSPGPGGDPTVRVSGERPAGGREEGPAADGGRLVAGDGPASEGSVDPMAPAGAGEGGPLSEGGLPSEDAGLGVPSLVEGTGGPTGQGVGEGMGSGATVDVPLLELDPDTVAKEWVDLQWEGAADSMGELVDAADAGGRSSMAWGEVHARYGSLAEAATRRSRLPLTRRDYVRRYFEAIRPPPVDVESP